MINFLQFYHNKEVLMPKIKDLSNELIQQYISAYQSKLRKDPDNQDLMYKIRAMEKALQDRSLLGINIKEKKQNTFLIKLKNLFSRKKD